jgi:hypothetical protein
MNSFQSKPPRIYADRLMPMVMKAMKEYHAMEDDPKTIEAGQYLTVDEYDTKMRNLQNLLRDVYKELQNDTIRGDTALERIEAYFVAHSDLMEPLIETGNFPELRALNEI